jgi:large subunit ribosomal protein L40e
MPIQDVEKLKLAQRYLLYIKICRNCGSKNSPKAVKCRRCKSKNLRWKHRELKK